MIILASNKVLPLSSVNHITNGAVAVDGRDIVDVGTRSSLTGKYPSARFVDLGEVTIMPGLVNTHAHLELSYLKGLHVEERDFFRWIIRLIDKRRELGTTGLRAASSKALKQAVGTGTTVLGDVSGTGLVAGGIKSSGIRGVIYHELIGMDPRTAEGSVEHLENRLGKYAGLPDRIVQGVSPHSPYSVSGELFGKIGDIISENALRMCVHVAESVEEIKHIKGGKSGIDDYLKYTGWSRHRTNNARSSVSLLDEYGLLEDMLVVHAVHISRTDVRRLAKRGASVAHCPRSNHLLGVGKAPVRRLLDAGVNVSLGTDSLASNLDLDMWEEMRFAYLVNELTPLEAIRMATVNGARALGLEGVTGTLEPGREADLIAVRSPATKSRDPYPALVCETRGDDVVMSMVQGRVIYNKDGIEL